MKQPVNPILMRAMQRKREAGIKLSVWATVVTLVLLAWTCGLFLAYALGGGDALGVFAGASFVVAVFTIPLSFMAVEPVLLIERYLHYSRELKELSNEIAWNAQQEELARLRTIMKEEEL